MLRLGEDRTAVGFRPDTVAGTRRIAEPRASGVAAVLIDKGAFQHEALFAARVVVVRHAAVGGEAVERHALGIAWFGVERQAGQPVDAGLLKGGGPRVDGDVGAVRALCLAQLDEERAAFVRPGRVAEAFRVEEVRTGALVSGFIGEHAAQHEDLFARRVTMRGKAAARREPDNGRNAPALRRTQQLEPLAENAFRRAWLPVHCRGVGHRAGAEIRVQAVLRQCSPPARGACFACPQ